MVVILRSLPSHPDLNFSKEQQEPIAIATTEWPRDNKESYTNKPPLWGNVIPNVVTVMNSPSKIHFLPDNKNRKREELHQDDDDPTLLK